MISKFILQTQQSWGAKQMNYNEHNFISESDVNVLKDWIKNSLVPFSNFKGKVLFLKDTTFPRYKFTEYSRNNNQIVKRVKEGKNADAIIIDSKEYLNYLNNLNSYYRYYQKIAETGPNKEETQVYIEVSDDKAPYTVHGRTFGIYYRKEINYLKNITTAYQNFSSLKLINVFDVQDCISKDYTPINKEYSTQIDTLLASTDPQNVKLGMEILTNCDIEASLLYIMMLSNKHYYQRMRGNMYTTSTAWKSFVNTLSSFGVHMNSFTSGNSPETILQQFLMLKNKMIFEEDVQYVKEEVKDYINKLYNFDTTGFTLENFNVSLKIDQDKIIKKDIEEESDKKDEDILV